jgi:hypothetical protein
VKKKPVQIVESTIGVVAPPAAAAALLTEMPQVKPKRVMPSKIVGVALSPEKVMEDMRNVNVKMPPPLPNVVGTPIEPDQVLKNVSSKHTPIVQEESMATPVVEEEESMATPVVEEEETAEESMATPVVSNEEEEESMATPVVSNEEEEESMATPVVEEEETAEESMATPVVANEEEETAEESMATPVVVNNKSTATTKSKTNTMKTPIVNEDGDVEETQEEEEEDDNIGYLI